MLRSRDGSMRQLATIPALTARDLTCKLAGLVAEILAISAEPDLGMLTLAASALVDAVTLENGQINLPPNMRFVNHPDNALGRGEA